jgi:hypothetical protein
MGPPPFDGGNKAPAGIVGLPATARNARRPMITEVLQWGHRLSTVETAVGDSLWLGWAAHGHYQRYDARQHPSMGPPPFDGGNSPTMCLIPGERPPLQWGHRLSTVETLGITHMR